MTIAFWRKSARITSLHNLKLRAEKSANVMEMELYIDRGKHVFTLEIFSQ